MFNKKYNINNLSVATIATICRTNDTNYKYISVNKILFITIIDTKNKKNIKIDIGKTKEGYYDIINQDYYIHSGNCGYFDMCGNLHLRYIIESTPLREYLKKDSKITKISKNELLDLYNKINNINPNFEIKKREKKKKADIKNQFFLEIVRIREIIEKSTSDDIRSNYIEKLKTIAKKYTDSLIENYEQIKNNPDYEFKILKEYLSLLSELETEISTNIQKEEYSSNLLDQFDTLSSVISDNPSKLEYKPSKTKESK